MKTSTTLAGLALATVFAAQPALAQLANVPFTGAVTSTCILTVATPGILAPDAGFTSLASTNPGGLAGNVSVLSTGGAFSVSADAPTAFTSAPAGGDTGVDFFARYQGSGATTIGDTAGTTPTPVNAGLTLLSVNLLAEKSSGTFPAGAYLTEVVVRCE